MEATVAPRSSVATGVHLYSRATTQTDDVNPEHATSVPTPSASETGERRAGIQ
ncbi:MAG: hypothetical protein JWR11_6191 [Mycobacterium sp.]|nr:hypothetical protein [Mycobacterium sp.]